jgi:hypothetical protein
LGFVLRNIFRVVDRRDALLGDAVDGAQQVFDYVFKLALVSMTAVMLLNSSGS